MMRWRASVYPVDAVENRSADSVPITPPFDSSAPVIPGFEILGELGRGAMGVVYRARQTDLGRIVALKMILAGDKARESDFVRFQTEAEAAAALQHPNVAQLYEIGRYQGLPYFAMEFCPGGSLADRLQDTVLPPNEAAELVRTLANAIQAAHELGILHRDLKPANILIADCGLRIADSLNTQKPDATLRQSATRNSQYLMPKITDFGMAKRFNPGTGEAASNLTHAGTIIGTPSYMAPEQTDGNSFPQSDVYSLGAILYQCLTGRPPFKGATSLDTLMSVLDDEPVPPSKLVAKVPPDLEAICLKCLEKPVAKRYQSAAELEQDLDRFLTGLPTIARPLSTPAHLVKWAKRRPAVAGLVGLGFVSVLVLGGLSIGLWRALGEADRQRDRAVATVTIALSAVDDLLEQEDLPGAGDPEVQRQAMLDSVSRSLEKLGRYSGDDRELLARSAKAYLRRGRLLVDVAKLQEAVVVYSKAVELARQQLALHPSDLAWRREQATAVNRLGGAYDRLGDVSKATAAYQEAEELRRALVSESHDPDDEHDLATTLYNRAGFDADLANQPAAATKRFEESRAILTGLVNRHPDQTAYQNSLAKNWFNWGRYLSRQNNRLEESLVATEQAKKLWAKLVEREPASTLYQTQLAACLSELGKLHHQHGDPREAYDQYVAALQTAREVAKRHPKVATYQGMLGLTCSNLGQLDVPDNPPESRMKLLDEAVRALTAAQGLPMFRSQLADALLALARSQHAAGLSDAVRTIDQAVVRYEELANQFPDNEEYRTRLATARSERAKMMDF